MQRSTHSPGYSSDHPAEDLALTELWLVIRKSRLLLASAALGLGLLAAMAALYRGPRYTATGEIQVQPGSAAELKQSIPSVLSGGGTLDVVLESDLRILQSEKLLTVVAGTLHLRNDPRFPLDRGDHGIPWLRRNAALRSDGNLDDPYLRNAVLKVMRRHLTVARVPRTQMITISYVSGSPQLSADIVNDLESELIKSNFVAHYSATEQVTHWLTQQIDDLRATVQDSQDRMVDLQKKLGISALDPNHSMIVGEITSLEKGASDATEQRILLEARYRILQSLPPARIQESSSGISSGERIPGLLDSLRAQRTAAGIQQARSQTYYGPNYPETKQLNAQIKSLDSQIATEEMAVVDKAKDAYITASNAENEAGSLLAKRVHELYSQRDNIVRYELLTEQYESNRHMYESILSRLREATVDAGLDSADISVVDIASLPIEPSSMSPLAMGGLGTFFGICGGLALALALERADPRMRDSLQIQRLLDVPAIAIVPQTDWKAKSSNSETTAGPEIIWDSKSSFAESIRVLRTSIQLSGTSRESRVIAITSCQPSEGKSTVSINLGATLAQGGKKVILVDTDMRRPSIYGRLGLSNKTGLAELLAGLIPLSSVIQTHQTILTLDVIASGVSPSLPADLLASDEMKSFVNLLRGRYEYVIFDCPPALSVTDPLIVASLSDGLVLVVRQGVCTRAMLARVREICRDVGIKLYGFVLNGVDPRLPEYYGYLGYYSYDYKN